MPAASLPEARLPTRGAAAVHAGKAAALQIRRGFNDATRGIRRHPQEPATAAFPCLLAEVRAPLWSRDAAPAEQRLQRGKVQNLRCAVRRLDGCVVPADALFSFWKQVGRATARRGFAEGRELREGCLIPAIGGGLCQLSNALYEAALQAHLEIVERHTHSRVVPGSIAAATGRDATVAWNYIDLRFRASFPLQIAVRLTADELIVRFHGLEMPSLSPEASAPPLPRRRRVSLLDPAVQNCHACGSSACFRHPPAPRADEPQRTAYLVDECWPEFRAYLRETAHGPQDTLAVPLDGKRWRIARYRWETEGFGSVTAATASTLMRSAIARRLVHQPAPRQRAAQIAGSERLARALAARALTPEVTHLCVAQTLLPFLWREGHLGGRTFDVLMTRLPLHLLHTRLDAALAAHPDRNTLGDFRAPDALVQDEETALAAARRVVTPHAEIAALFPETAHRLAWHIPPPPAPSVPESCGVIAFPGPTAARKGAYEVRAAARSLNLTVALFGGEFEGGDFWKGVTVERRAFGPNALTGVAAVVQPALVEDKPRALLAALASGIPVIATAACGLGTREGVQVIPPGSAAALTDAIAAGITSAG